MPKSIHASDRRLGAAQVPGKPCIGIDLLVLSQFTDTGMVTYTQEILPRLFEAMPDCEWVLFLKDTSNLTFDPARYANVKVKRSRWMACSWAWKLGGVILEPVLEGIDLLFIPVSRAPLIKTCKLIVFVHDVGFLTLPEYLKAGTVRKTQLAMQASERKADLLLTNSIFTRDEFCRHYKTRASKIDVTYLGFDDHRFNPRPVPDAVTDEVLRRYGIRKPYVLYLGVIQGRKNLLRLLAAREIWQERIPGLQLVLAGKKGWNCDEIYERALRSPGDVVLAGRIEPEHLAILYKNAECYVLPSLYEGFGMPVIEAMACGIPTVLSERGSLPEIGADAAEYFNPEDPQMIANAILKVVQSPGLRCQMIARGLERAAEFTWTRIGENTVQAFQKVLASA